MRLVVQVPCLNEAPRLAAIIGAIPCDIAGVELVEIRVGDNGSTDETAEVARETGADPIVRFTHNRGLSVAFQTGLREALRAGADIVVNTDGDDWYEASSSPDLIAPILAGEADISVGDRRPQTIQSSRGSSEDSSASRRASSSSPERAVQRMRRQGSAPTPARRAAQR